MEVRFDTEGLPKHEVEMKVRRHQSELRRRAREYDEYNNDWALHSLNSQSMRLFADSVHNNQELHEPVWREMMTFLGIAEDRHNGLVEQLTNSNRLLLAAERNPDWLEEVVITAYLFLKQNQ